VGSYRGGHLELQLQFEALAHEAVVDNARGNRGGRGDWWAFHLRVQDALAHEAVVDNARGNRGERDDWCAVTYRIEVVLVAAIAVVLEIQLYRGVAREDANLEPARRGSQSEKFVLNRRDRLAPRRYSVRNVANQTIEAESRLRKIVGNES